jgi:hypothetical protein
MSRNFLLHAVAVALGAALQPCLDSIFDIADNELGHNFLQYIGSDIMISLEENHVNCSGSFPELFTAKSAKGSQRSQSQQRLHSEDPTKTSGVLPAALPALSHLAVEDS